MAEASGILHAFQQEHGTGLREGHYMPSMNPWRKAHPEERIRELEAEREYHLKALENIETQIQKQRELMG